MTAIIYPSDSSEYSYVLWLSDLLRPLFSERNFLSKNSECLFTSGYEGWQESLSPKFMKNPEFGDFAFRGNQLAFLSCIGMLSRKDFSCIDKLKSPINDVDKICKAFALLRLAVFFNEAYQIVKHRNARNFKELVEEGDFYNISFSSFYTYHCLIHGVKYFDLKQQGPNYERHFMGSCAEEKRMESFGVIEKIIGGLTEAMNNEEYRFVFLKFFEGFANAKELSQDVLVSALQVTLGDMFLSVPLSAIGLDIE